MKLLCVLFYFIIYYNFFVTFYCWYGCFLHVYRWLEAKCKYNTHAILNTRANTPDFWWMLSFLIWSNIFSILLVLIQDTWMCSFNCIRIRGKCVLYVINYTEMCPIRKVSLCVRFMCEPEFQSTFFMNWKSLCSRLIWNLNNIYTHAHSHTLHKKNWTRYTHENWKIVQVNE